MALNCDSPRNANKKECLSRVGEAHFTMILPKADNNKKRIKPEVHKKFINQVNDHFGGSTIKPITLGCWHDNERKVLQCETGLAVETLRDFDADSKLKRLNAIERKKVLKKDYKKLQRIAKDAALEMGQASIPVIYDNVADISFIEGEWKPSIDENKTTGETIEGDVFEKNI